MHERGDIMQSSKQKRKQMLKPGEIIPIIYDYVFTSIFNNPKNIDILEVFIADILNIPLEKIKGKVELQPRELEIQNKNNKNAQIDLLVNIKGAKINIELQKQKSKGIEKRNFVYHSLIHGNQMEYGNQDYSSINYSIQIRLNNYRSNDEEIVEESCMRTENGRIVEEFFRIYEVDMVLGEKLWYTNRDEKVARWCRLVRVATMKELKEVIGDGFMGKEVDDKLIEEVNRYSTDNRVIALYTKLSREELEKNTLLKEAKEEGYDLGYDSGYDSGFDFGIEQTKMELARNLKQNGVDVNIISKSTKLSIEKIEEL